MNSIIFPKGPTMIDNQLRSRIEEMKCKYLEAQENISKSSSMACTDMRKAKKIKKKLLTLEKERCQYILEHRDISAIDEKIALLKSAYLIDEGAHIKKEDN
ncbi:hypothetical protein ACRPMK_06105 [Streptococcus uberis]|uniref:hypothetical protein n=1 Tax=Streptococcus uberis TaxID=1349 RepID=UPI003D6BB6C7